MFVRPLSSFVRLPLLSPEGEGGGGGNQNPDPATPDGANPGEQGDAGKPRVEFTAEQMAEVGRIVAKERREAAEKAKNDAKADRAAADEQARKDRERQQEIDRGEFDKARTALESDAKAAKDEAAAVKAENDRLREAMKAGLESGWRALPDAVRKLGEKQHGEDDVLGRWAFLHDPDTAALVKDLTEKGPAARGNGRDPKPGNGTPEVTSLVGKQQFLG